VSAGPSSAPLDSGQFVQKWGDAMAQVLAEISGAPQPSAVLSEPLADVPGASGNDVWMLAALSGALRGEMSLRVPAKSAVRFAQTFMSEPSAPDAELSSDYRDALIELLRQGNGRFATETKPACGEVQIRLEAAAAPPSWPACCTAWFRFGEDAAAAFIELQLSAALVAELRAAKTEPAAPSAIAPAAGSFAPDRQAKLQALLHVELAVSLRFGSRRLLLRDILELNPGSVIELDRQVQEPVDLLLDGRVGARGEIVVVDGNYGLRVTEVVSP